MSIRIILISLLFSFSAWSSDESEIKALLHNYALIMGQHRIELIDKVFSQKFLLENGGKKEFIEKVKTLPLSKKIDEYQFKKGNKPHIYFASMKNKKNESELLINKENGVWKINGNMSDAD